MGWKDHEPAAGGAGDGSHSWRQPTSGRPAPETRHTSIITKSRSKKFVASSLAGACAVAFIWLLLLLSNGCTSSVLFVSTAFEYEGNKAGAIPPNWMGEDDRKSLQSLKDFPSVRNLSVIPFANEVEFHNKLNDQELNGLFPKKSNSEKKNIACVIFLSAHAVLESFFSDSPSDIMKVTEADLVLVAKDDDFASKAKRVRLTEVWNALKNLPEDQRKLVLLDVSRLRGQWRLGVFDNFAIEAIQAAVQREKIPNLFVITACSSGETSWVSPHLGESGQSVFAHFVARGLAGEADETNGKSKGDGSITVRELFRYVHTHVNDWVERYRDPVGQHPRLFAGDVDVQKVLQAKDDKTFSVGAVNTRNSDASKLTANSKRTPSDAIDKSRDQLFGLWKRRLALEQPSQPANAIYHLDPVGFRALTHRLMRAEEFLIHHHATAATTEIEKAETLCSKLEAHANLGHFAAASFTADEKFPSRLAKRFGLGTTRPAEGSAAPTSAVPREETPFALPDEHLAAVLSRAHKNHAMPVVMKESESVAVQKILVDLRILAEGVAFGHHTVLPWMRQELAEADHLRRRAEDSFFVVDTVDARQRRDLPKKGDTPSNSDPSTDKSREVRSLADEATRNFQNLQKRVQTLEDAQFTLNRVCATLPEWLAFVSDRSTNEALQKTRIEVMNRYHDPIRNNRQPIASILSDVGLTSKDNRPGSLDRLDKDILSAALQAIELRNLLPTNSVAISDEQIAKLDPAIKKFAELDQHIQSQLDAEATLLNTSQPQPIHWRLIRDLLRCPNLKPETRRDLFGKLLHLQPKEEAAKSTTLKETPQNDLQPAMWQMLCAIHALSLVPAPTGLAGDKLWNEWHNVSVEESRVSPERVIKLGRKLRDHWVRHLSEASTDCGSWQQSRELARICLEQKDLSARILFPSDAINLQEEPTRRYERFLIAELLLDTSERYLDDFWNNWYAAAAKSCSDAAMRLSGKLLDEDRKRVDDLFAAREKSELLLEAASVEFGTQKSAAGSVRFKRGEGLPRGLATSWLSYKDGDSRAVKGQSLADLCLPRSIGVIVARNAPSNVENQLSIAQQANPTQPKKGECQPSQIVPRVFFRDHTWSQKTTAKFNPCMPDGTPIRFLAAPSTGAIRVNGEDRKSVVFVLDASGSMVEKDGNGIVIPDRDRWTPAKAILLEVLNDMRRTNRATGAEPHQVELIVYGHRDPATKIEDHANVKIEVSMQPLTDALITDVSAKLNRFVPFGSTPLLTATAKACDSLTKAKTPGTIIVITDGVPNDGSRYVPQQQKWDTDNCLVVMPRLKQEIKDALRQAQSEQREMEFQVIGLGFQGIAPRNETVAREELEKFVKEANQRDGKFHRAEKFEDLRGALNLTTGARHFYVGDFEQPSRNKIIDGVLNQPLTDLLPGKYRIAFAYSDRLKDGLAIELKGGELLDFDLLPDRELKHIHPLSLKGSVPFRRSQERSGYSFGNLQSFRSIEGRAEFVLGIQNSESNRKVPYTERPERLLVEISPKDQLLKKAQAMTYRIETGKSDPTWTIQVDEWPEVSEAEIKAYASWSLVKPDEVLSPSSNLSWPPTVDVPISKTGRTKFQVEVETPPNDRIDLEDSVQVRLKLSDPTDASLLAGNWRHLAYLHVQLWNDDQPISHLDETAEVIATANEIRWKFSKLPQGFQAKRLKIAVTSWYTFELNALTLEQPLTIKSE